MPQINLKEDLLKLNKNYSILKEREAKYAGNAPLDLLNQIEDHEQAIELTQQAISGDLSQSEWQEALKPLLLAVNNGQVVNIEVETYIVVDQITVMLSSTIENLFAERDAVIKAFEQFPFIEIIGAKPMHKVSSATSPYLHTLNLAKSCDFYILVLEERYGIEIHEGMSAVEAEFDAAYQDNPTKVLIFQKEDITPEEKQKKFITKVGDYHKGFWITKYKYPYDLKDLVTYSFLALLKDRASIGYRLNYFDHFVRIAIQRQPSPEATVNYSVKEDLIELSYKVFGNNYVVHFNKSQIYSDFWGCVAELENLFSEWGKK